MVQFYRRDEELASSVGRYLAGAVLAGGMAVLVATPSHAEAITAVMDRAGVDLPAARRDGRLLAMDAESLLSRFVTGGRVDRGAFMASAGRLIGDAGARRPVAVYGEMVAVLWAAGDVMAAAELEELWNDLARQIPFSLYCGYPDRSFDADEEARARLCQLHTAVIGRDARPGTGGRPAVAGNGQPDLRVRPGLTPGGPAFRPPPAPAVAPGRRARRGRPGTGRPPGPASSPTPRWW